MHMLNPTILLLRQGTDNSQGKTQILSNINAIQAIVDVVKSTLGSPLLSGPRGMDKMITQQKKTTITNDGVTILEMLQIEHPAAKILVDIAKAQDNQVGDGTTTVTLLAGQILKQSKNFIQEGMNPQILIKGYKEALKLSLQKLQQLSFKFPQQNTEEKRNMLLKCAMTALNSKLLAGYKQHFAQLVVSAVEKLDPSILDKQLIGIKQVTGGSIGVIMLKQDSFLVEGVAFKKTFSYAGFQQQPKKFQNPKIILLKIELELKAQRDNSQIRIEDVEEFQNLVDAQWNIIYEKMNKMKQLGAQVVLSQLPIGDLATQWFADRGIFCAGRVAKEDIIRLAKSTGAIVVNSVNNLDKDVLGTCGFFEQKQIGAQRFNIFQKCAHVNKHKQTKSATIVLRGAAQQFIKQAQRSLNDAIMIVRRCYKTKKYVVGGGAIQMQLSKFLRNYSRQISGKEQFAINSFAKSLQVIPRTIADNGGIDSVEVMNKLRHKHATSEDGKFYGIDVQGPTGLCNTNEIYVWEPTLVKQNALASATQAVCIILSIDETVRNPRSEQEVQQKRINKAAPKLLKK